MRFVIVTGMSGAGKGTAMKMLEDAGYFCVDNLPFPLITKLSELTSMPSTEINKIAVGVDLKDGKVAIRGWTETSELDAFTFCEKMQNLGVKTIICTDISKDGAMKGTNRELYETMSRELTVNITASGGVSSLEELRELQTIGTHAAILGKALYTGRLDLKTVIEEVG